ncbi:PEP-CTERM sorting domain-containing protein [Tunturiibacter gelidoferens]|uniref:Ice-binding protein C-terminal domain-containing protein n=3 Tax=Tunturiibacter TaxID=3154218 RepID=A0A7Y9TAA9_9BACT|nr:PEP-CTERM sorting domain-containing protein [Edaphobacter lichenicola]MBB5338608.1 hypothetical protein [Edaphobacter lichenicola]NYF52140.1 hypothetical protein [Edaphobacter lichenicola]
MRKTLFALALLASALSIPLTAHADTIDQLSFDFPHISDGHPGVLTIDLPASPQPYLPFVSGLFLGQSGSVDYLVQIGELSPTETLIGYAFYVGGPIPPARAFTQIYFTTALLTGPVDAPTFLTGTFNGVYKIDVPFLPPYPGTLTIEPLTNSTVPEPSSLALMATGILGAITTLRHRKSMSRPMSRSRTS